MSLAMLLEMAVSGFPDRIALGPREGGLSFSELSRRAAGGGAVITRHRAEQVLFVGRNGPEYPQAMFAAVLAGVPFVPLNYRMSAHQLGSLVDGLQNSLAIADADYLTLLAGFGVPVMTTDEFVAAASARESAGLAEPPAFDGDAPAVMLFTSGTTALPRAAVLRHANLLSYIFSTVEFGNASEGDAALVALPPYHVAAVSSVLSNIYSGRRVLSLPDFDAAAWLRVASEEQVTSAMLVPTMLARIVDVVGDAPAVCPALRLISYGGARMPRPVLEHALRVFPDVDFVNAYGLTETSSTIALLGPDDHRVALRSADPAVRARLGSAGRPVPGVEIQIRGDAGTVVAEGEVGSLWVRGGQVSGEYRGIGSLLDADGWFPTRDLAHTDAAGYLFIDGRADETIIRGGENIAPAEIEDVLMQHPSVKDVAVVGLADDEWGHQICAVVVRKPGAEVTADEIRKFVRQRLRGSRTPDAVIWRDELSYSATGKLLRRQIAAELASQPVPEEA